MKQKIAQIIFPVLLVLTLFSLWAGIALLIINKTIYEELPGYTIGKLCIWELIALIVAILIAYLMIKNWGNLEIQQINDRLKLTLNFNYGIYFLVYFLIALIVSIWQFWIFSQNY